MSKKSLTTKPDTKLPKLEIPTPTTTMTPEEFRKPVYSVMELRSRIIKLKTPSY